LAIAAETRWKRSESAKLINNQQNKMISFAKKHKKISLAVLLALAVAGYWFFKPSGGDEMITVYTYGTAQTGAVTQSVSGTGQISPARELNLKSKVAGLVLGVGVSAGQAVKSGDAIALIDDSDAREDIDDARESLESARLSLEKLNEPPDELSLMQAQNALENAKETLAGDQEDLAKTYEYGFDAVVAAFADLPSIMEGMQNIVVGASSYVTQSNSSYIDYYSDAVKGYDTQAPEMAASAAAAYRKAKSQYDANFQNYKLMSRASASNNEIEELINQTYDVSQGVATTLKNANVLIQRYKDVLIDRNLTPQGFADTQLASLASYTSKNNSHVSALFSAAQNIVSAKKAIIDDEYTIEEKTKSLEKITQAPDELELRSAQLSVAQKERALANTIDDLGNYAIGAPFDGVIASVDIDEGEEISSGGTVATIIGENQIAVVTLNEVDIVKVKTGQKAILTFSAVDDLTMTGKVIEVGVLGSVSQGVVSYDVVIALDTASEQVKSGMSISAVIITDMRQNVLTVPLTAVKSGNEGSYVLIPDGELVKQQAVTIGLSDDDYVEIVGGLAEGDQIVVSSAKQNAGNKSSTNSSSASNRSGSMFNIGGMGGPMR